MRDADLIWQTAVVRQEAGGRTWLEFSDPLGCSRCSRGTGCGAALFSRLFARPQTRLPMPGNMAIQADRPVRVGLEPRWLMLAAVVVYLLPATAFVAGAVVANQIWPGSDPAALLSGVFLVVLCVLLLRNPLRVVHAPRMRLVELCPTDQQQGLESAD